jgi:hypothetical protein
MSVETDSRKSHEARRLLDDPIFQEAISAVRSAIYVRLEGPKFDNAVDADLVTMLRLLGALESTIRRWAETGKVADFMLAQEQKRKRST